jgi:15-cis-phytoene synthase
MSDVVQSRVEVQCAVSLAIPPRSLEPVHDVGAIELVNGPAPTVGLGYEARHIMRRHAKSFDWAARFLAPATRDDTRLLYAFARLADDLADEPELGELPERLAALANLKSDVCTSTWPPPNRDPLTHAMVRLRQHHGLSVDLFEGFLDSLMADAHPRCLLTEQDLWVFAYGVAGTVGLMMRPLLGAAPEGDLHALALGLAMQLTNIARDVVEDAERGRTYIPASLGVHADALHRPQGAAERRQAFAAIERVLAWAEAFYAFAQQGLGQIPKSNRRAIRIALCLYRGIGRKILSAGPERYWQGRACLSGFEKLHLTAMSLAGMNRAQTFAAAMPTRAEVLAALQSLQGLPGFPAA